jgi:hypothetical protein
MRNVLALFAAVMLLVAGVGWYRGWYRVQNSPAPPGHHAVNIDIDKDKIGKDLHEGEEELQKVLENKLRDKSDKRAEKSPADANVPNLKPKTPVDPKMPIPTK